MYTAHPVLGSPLFLVLTSSPRIDGPLIVTIILSGALVFIPILKAIKSRNK